MKRPDAAAVAGFAQAILALALLVAVIAWRDTDPSLRWTMPAIGAAGLGIAWVVRNQLIGRWLTIAVDVWFVLFGLMLGMSVTADQASFSGQADPGPDVIAQLNRFETWLDPMVHRPVAAAFLIAGTIGIIAAIRARSPSERSRPASI
jgi:hypothetical protein